MARREPVHREEALVDQRDPAGQRELVEQVVLPVRGGREEGLGPDAVREIDEAEGLVAGDGGVRPAEKVSGFFPELRSTRPLGPVVKVFSTVPSLSSWTATSAPDLGTPQLSTTLTTRVGLPLPPSSWTKVAPTEASSLSVTLHEPVPLPARETASGCLG
jgi:hypothetical protein